MEKRMEVKMNTKLWYRQPAESFREALPLGNGSMGAMVYGKVPAEEVLLNLDTFWSGMGTGEEKVVPREGLRQVRELVFGGNYKAAQEYLEKDMLGHYNESYMPFGILKITYSDVESYKNYMRMLDLKTAVVTTGFQTEDHEYRNEMFLSYPDQVLAVRITSAVRKNLNLRISLSSRIRYVLNAEEEGCLIMTGNAPSHVEPNYVKIEDPITYGDPGPGMAFCGYLRVRIQGGTLSFGQDGIKVEGASAAELYFTAADGYEGYKKPVDEAAKHCVEKCDKRLRQVFSRTYLELRTRHIEDYRSVNKDTEFDLGEPEQAVPTDVRLQNLKNGAEDKGLYCLYFHYGRYLMVSSSRTGSQPANLQGIWSDSLRPAWSSNWTTNINIEMNYWPAGMCNLMECYEPLVKLVEELSDAGRRTAQSQCRCRGWAANHNVDLWRQTDPVDGLAKYAYWPMGGVWLSGQIYDYYKYTQDVQYLRTHIYPAMRGAALFCLDWLIPGEDGRYHTCPSTSPENVFLDDADQPCSVSYSSTLDIALIRELFKNFIDASEKLQTEDEIVSQVRERLAHLPEYQIGKYGQLQEWILDFEEADPGHRHFSPLFAFHPGTTIHKYDDPKLVDACRAFIQRRLEYGGGVIGWSCAWLINLYARLCDGENALQYLRQLLKASTYENLFDFHPPLGEGDGEYETFQIDGNLGGISGIANMLLQSHLGVIELLPALPAEWEHGSVRRLLAERGVSVDITWRDGRVLTADFISDIAQEIDVIYPCLNEPVRISLKKKERYYLAPEY